MPATPVFRGLRQAAQAAKNPLQDLAAYPILTEEVGYPPSPVSTPGGTSGGAGTGTAGLGQIVNKALSETLGWKVKAGDTKGFLGALTQSFTLSEVEGHIESKWTPRTYVVQTDLAGGITGAQASIYTRGKEALDQSLPLLDGLYALDPEADQEDVVALKAVVKSQLNELVNEMRFLGGPRITRVNKYFQLLLSDRGPFPPMPKPDPDKLGGTLGNLRDVLGLNFNTQDFVNSVDDEQNLSNFRILADYVISLAQSWVNNLPFLGLDTSKPFFGTQLVLLSRQLAVVAESVDEVRFTFDSVFIGPAERQATEIRYPGQPGLKPIFLEDLLSWIYNFATEEGPRLIQDGGKFGVQNTFTPMVRQLLAMVSNIPKTFNPANPLPAGFFAPRVVQAKENLVDELNSLLKLAKPIKHTITSEPDFALPFQVLSVQPITVSDLPAGTTASGIPIIIRGNGFQAGAQVSIQKLTGTQTFFRSESLLVAMVSRASVAPLNNWKFGSFDVTVKNQDGTSFTLNQGLSVEP